MKIRSVKPEFWQSEKLATKTTRDARLLLIGLLCCADDYGRFRAHPSLLAGELFAYEPDADVAGWLSQLVAIGIVKLYQVDGASYGVVVNFEEHQKIDQRWASRLPAPPAEKPATPNTHPTRKPAGSTRKPAGSAEQPAGHAGKPRHPADSTPTDRIGSEGNGVPPLPPRPKGRAEGQRAAPDRQKQSAEPGKGPPAAVTEMQQLLLCAGYRSNKRQHDRERETLARAAELHALAITPPELRILIEHDRDVADRPCALLSTWIERGECRSVLDELANKAKERGLRARGDRDDDIDPKPAMSLVGAALANVGGRPA